MAGMSEEFLYHLGRLETLLENEYYTINKNMQGGFVAPYQKNLETEMEQLQEMIRKFRNQIR